MFVNLVLIHIHPSLCSLHSFHRFSLSLFALICHLRSGFLHGFLDTFIKTAVASIMLHFLPPTPLTTVYTVNSIAALSVVGDASCSVLSQTKSSYWQPKAGTTFQIVLQGALKNSNTDVTAFDIDLIANEASVISDLHSKGRKVICYFSAGSYEDYRPDSKAFQASDYGRPFGRLARVSGG